MLQSPVTTPAGRAERIWPRIAGATFLLVAGGIHVYEFLGEDLMYLAVLYLLSAAGMLIGAVLLLARAPRLGWLIGGLSALLTFGGYVYSRLGSLPADASDTGNWLQPDGVASVLVEFIVTVVALWALTGRRRLMLRHAREEIRVSVPGVSGPEVTSDLH